jgi:hypothetical protein
LSSSAFEEELVESDDEVSVEEDDDDGDGDGDAWVRLFDFLVVLTGATAAALPDLVDTSFFA